MAPAAPCPTVDVAVLGGGLAGLSAAHTIEMYNMNATQPVSYAVIEAIDRVGGKTQIIPAVDDVSSIIGGVVDEGASYINDKYHTHLADFAHQYGFEIEVQWSTGDTVVEFPKGVSKGPSSTFGFTDAEQIANIGLFIQYLDTIADTVDLHNLSKTPLAKKWDNMNIMQLTKEFPGYNPLIGKMIKIVTRTIIYEEPERVSALYWLEYVKSNINVEFLVGSGRKGAQYQRVREGAGSFAIKIAEDLKPGPVYLNSPVREVIHDKESGLYTIKTKNGKTFRARHIITTLPYPLWNTIEFTPPLPAAKRSISKQASMGRVSKGLAVWAEPWWRNDSLAGQMSSTEGPITTALDSSVEPDHQYTLTCFISADDVPPFDSLTKAEQQHAVFSQIEDTMGKYHQGPVPRPAAVHTKNWGQEEYFRGGPCAVTHPGLLTSAAGQSLRDPVGNIRFAGTDLAYKFKGYMEGAVRSGKKVATDILSDIYSHDH